MKIEKGMKVRIKAREDMDTTFSISHSVIDENVGKLLTVKKTYALDGLRPYVSVEENTWYWAFNQFEVVVNEPQIQVGMTCLSNVKYVDTEVGGRYPIIRVHDGIYIIEDGQGDAWEIEMEDTDYLVLTDPTAKDAPEERMVEEDVEKLPEVGDTVILYDVKTCRDMGLERKITPEMEQYFGGVSLKVTYHTTACGKRFGIEGTDNIFADEWIEDITPKSMTESLTPLAKGPQTSHNWSIGDKVIFIHRGNEYPGTIVDFDVTGRPGLDLGGGFEGHDLSGKLIDSGWWVSPYSENLKKQPKVKEGDVVILHDRAYCERNNTRIIYINDSMEKIMDNGNKVTVGDLDSGGDFRGEFYGIWWKYSVEWIKEIVEIPVIEEDSPKPLYMEGDKVILKDLETCKTIPGPYKSREIQDMMENGTPIKILSFPSNGSFHGKGAGDDSTWYFSLDWILGLEEFEVGTLKVGDIITFKDLETVKEMAVAPTRPASNGEMDKYFDGREMIVSQLLEQDRFHCEDAGGSYITSWYFKEEWIKTRVTPEVEEMVIAEKVEEVDEYFDLSDLEVGDSVILVDLDTAYTFEDGLTSMNESGLMDEYFQGQKLVVSQIVDDKDFKCEGAFDRREGMWHGEKWYFRREWIKEVIKAPKTYTFRDDVLVADRLFDDTMRDGLHSFMIESEIFEGMLVIGCLNMADNPIEDYDHEDLGAFLMAEIEAEDKDFWVEKLQEFEKECKRIEDEITSKINDRDREGRDNTFKVTTFG